MEADVFPLHHPDLSDQIDGAIGERSSFHKTFGYYAHGVGENTATLPTGWKERLVLVQNQNTGGGAGLCLDPHDLAASKLAAGREKDIDFVRIMMEEKMFDISELEKRIRTLTLPAGQLDVIQARFQRLKSRDETKSKGAG